MASLHVRTRQARDDDDRDGSRATASRHERDSCASSSPRTPRHERESHASSSPRASRQELEGYASDENSSRGYVLEVVPRSERRPRSYVRKDSDDSYDDAGVYTVERPRRRTFGKHDDEEDSKSQTSLSHRSQNLDEDAPYPFQPSRKEMSFAVGIRTHQDGSARLAPVASEPTQFQSQKDSRPFKSGLSGDCRAFASIQAGDFQACKHFVLGNWLILDEEANDFLPEALAALDAGREEYAANCVQSSIIIRDCSMVSKRKVRSYFDRLILGKEEAHRLRKDVADAIGILREKLPAPSLPSLRLGALDTDNDATIGYRVTSSARHRSSDTAALSLQASQPRVHSSPEIGSAPRVAAQRERYGQQPNNEFVQASASYASPLTAAFSDIPLGMFKQCSTFIKANPRILEDNDQDYLQEAITALRVGRPNHSNNCIQQALILYKCRNSSPGQCRVFFASLAEAESNVLNEFIRDFESTWLSCRQQALKLGMNSGQAATGNISLVEIKAALRKGGHEDVSNTKTNFQILQPPATPHPDVSKAAALPAPSIRSKRESRTHDTTKVFLEMVAADQGKKTSRVPSPSEASLSNASRLAEAVVAWDATIDSEGERSFVGGSSEWESTSGKERDQATFFSKHLARSVLHKYAGSFLNKQSATRLAPESPSSLESRRTSGSSYVEVISGGGSPEKRPETKRPVINRPTTGESSKTTLSKYNRDTLEISSTSIAPSVSSSRKRPVNPDEPSHTSKDLDRADDSDRSYNDKPARKRKDGFEKPTEKLDAGESDGGGGLKKPCRSGATQSPKDRIFACPYYRYDCIRYSARNIQERAYRGCSTVFLRDIPRLKQHLYRVHRRPEHYCGSCYRVFDSQGQLEAHTRQRPACENAENPFQEKMDKDQMKEIKKRNIGMTSHAEWFKIYATLFPATAEPPESHAYAEYESAAPMQDFLAYFEAEAPAMLARFHSEYVAGRVVLDQRVQEIWDDGQAHAVSRLVDAFRTGSEAPATHDVEGLSDEPHPEGSRRGQRIAANAALVEQLPAAEDTINWVDLLEDNDHFDTEIEFEGQVDFDEGWSVEPLLQ